MKGCSNSAKVLRRPTMQARPHSLRAEKTHEVITTCHLRRNQSSHIQTLTLEPEIFISLSRKSRALITGRQHSANTNIASKLLQTNACLVNETSKTPIGAAHTSDILQRTSNLCKQPRAAMIRRIAIKPRESAPLKYGLLRTFHRHY